MKHLDLFSGIGGFALAADTVFGNVEHTFVEIDPFCQEILKKHWPESEVHHDIRQFIADTERKGWSRKGDNTSGQHGQLDRSWENETPYILTGGFPCQPFSQAGRRKGTNDERYLWPEMFRVIQLYQPQWVIAENVRGLTTWNEGMVLEQVCTDLESEGYEVQPLIIPACGVNAPHRRERVWIIAHAQHDGKFRTQNATVNSGLQPKIETREKLSIDESKGVDSLRKKKTRRNTFSDRGSDQITTNSNDTRGGASEYDDHQDRSQSNTRRQRQPLNRTSRQGWPDWSRDWQEVAFATCNDGVDDRIPRKLGNTTISSARWRREALKAYGNAIVPQVAIEIMKAIKLTKKD